MTRRSITRKPLNYFLIAFILAASSTAYSQDLTPLATVKAFFAFDATHSQIFTRNSIDARKKWFSKDLYQLFLNEIKREKEYLKKNPTDKPHFGDGLPFRPLNEPCNVGRKNYLRKISYGTVTITGDTANVDVYFKYPEACKIPDIVYAISLEKEERRWVFSDIGYFPGDASLVQDLTREEY